MSSPHTLDTYRGFLLARAEELLKEQGFSHEMAVTYAAGLLPAQLIDIIETLAHLKGFKVGYEAAKGGQ